MPTPESKSPVKLSAAILGIVFVLCIGGYLAMESLGGNVSMERMLVGMLKVGIQTDSPVITRQAAEWLEDVGGEDVWWKLREDGDLVVFRFACNQARRKAGLIGYPPLD